MTAKISIALFFAFLVYASYTKEHPLSDKGVTNGPRITLQAGQGFRASTLSDPADPQGRLAISAMTLEMVQACPAAYAHWVEKVINTRQRPTGKALQSVIDTAKSRCQSPTTV